MVYRLCWGETSYMSKTVTFHDSNSIAAEVANLQACGSATFDPLISDQVALIIYERKREYSRIIWR
jgi:hypothetical protein